jgi:hypothetical protein
MTFEDYIGDIRIGRIDPPPAGPILVRLKDDSQRYLFCVAMMEYYRTLWYRGQAEQIDQLHNLSTKSLRLRYRQYNPRARRSIAAMMWARSAVAREYKDSEQMFCRWATLYATALGGRLENGSDLGTRSARAPRQPMRAV